MVRIIVLRNLLVIGILALALLVLLPTAIAANPQALLRPDPLSIGLRSGEQGLISIRVEDVQNLYGLEFHLTFDPNVVEVIDADATKPGVQIQPGDWFKNTFVAANKVDNQTGKIDYAVTLLNPAPPMSGGGTVATITFRAKSNGTSPLKVQRAVLASRDGKEIKSDWQDGAIGVSPLAVAPGVNPQPRTGEEADNSTASSLPIREIVLIGVAGLGMLVFFGALVFAVVGILFFRRR